MANLSLKHIYKVYPNGTKAVNDFNMQIDDKEFIVFVGPSGCGKSTMLRMVAGLEEISAGELRIGDVVVNDMEPKDRDIAMVFQNYALYPHMTIYENIAFGLQMRQVPQKDENGNVILDKKGRPKMGKMPKAEIDERVKAAAEILGITDYLQKKPKEMSGGQRQRVAHGRAIVREPKVMLLDEPLSNLDAKLRTQMRSEIVKLHERLQTTFIYVTHDQVEAMTMGTRIVVMKLGVIQQIDTPKNLYQMPANKFVAGFIGTPQMNFFEGTLKKIGDKVEIRLNGSQSVITIPYEIVIKAMPQYLDGNTKVCIGLRSEDVSIDPEVVKESNTTIKVKISHTEELGTETLVYGDINMDGDGFGDDSTRIVLKAAGFKNFSSGDVVDAALNMANVHLFDIETEKSIIPRVPEYTYQDCTVQKGVLSFAGTQIKLPPAMPCPDGAYELHIPVDAISLGGNISAEVVSQEVVNKQTLARLVVGNSTLFALLDAPVEGKKVNLHIDIKKLSICKDGNVVVKPMPLINSLEGTFAMDKVKGTVEVDGKVKSRMVPKYSIVILGQKFEAPADVAVKMFSAFTGRKVFNTSFRYELSPYDFTIGEGGITASVRWMINYGDEKFIECEVAGQTFYVKADKDYSGSVTLMPDFTKVGVTEIGREIKIV